MILSFRKTIEGTSKPTNFEEMINKGKKIHTIRSDEKNQWKEGMKIHFATGVRTKYYNCFKEGVCKSVQNIRIENHLEYLNDAKIFVDDRELSLKDSIELAKNDGFGCLVEFWLWFDEDFKGKVIHWTDKRY